MARLAGMSEQEEIDLAAMKAKVNERKIAAFDYMASTLQYTERDFTTSGHKGLQPMLEYIIRGAKKDVEKLHKEYIKKYPD